MPHSDNPFEPVNLTARRIRIGDARDEADRQYDLTGDRDAPSNCRSVP